MSQIFIFFFGGFDTTASVTSFALFELAKNPNCLKKLQEDIDNTLKKHNYEWTYDCIQDMKYLSQVLEETLRLYPSVPFLMRKAARDYKIPNSNVTLDKGTGVQVILYALHRDPKYFENPLQFDPERFTPEAKEKIIPYSYLPFGVGPRNCIGMRYGQLQSKIGLALLCSKFNLELAPEQSTDIKFSPSLMTVIGGLNLVMTRR